MELTTCHFHSGGELEYWRARRSWDRELREAIKATHADALSKASWLERQYLRFEMWCELLQGKGEPDKNAHKPSPYTLW